MASDKKAAAGWGFRLVAILLTLVVLAGVFGFAFSSTGNELKSIVHAAIPFGIALLVSALLGSLSKISHKRWQIYLLVLLIAAVVVCLRIAGLF